MATTETMPFGLIRKRKNGQLFTLSARLKKEGYISHLRPHGEEIAEKDKNPDFIRQGVGLLRFATPGLTCLGSF